MAKSSTLRKTALGSGPRIAGNVPIPSDVIGDFMAEARAVVSGQRDDDSDEVPSASSTPVARPAKAVPAIVSEPVIDRLLGGEHRSKFLLLADWFEGAVGGRTEEVCVETDVGDVKFEVIEWIVAPGFLKLVVDSSRMPFEPKSLAKMRLRRRGIVYSTTCVSPLSPMFGTLPFAELLLIIESESNTMEKNARIEAGKTPSAVSGKPSTDIDNEEPVAEGEKSASVRGALPDRDFDVPREG